MGAVYILENESMPGLIKIGRTELDTEIRADQLSSTTGVPTKFKVFKTYYTDNAVAAESAMHKRFAEYRVNTNREFFRITAEAAVEIIESEFRHEKVDPSEEFNRDDELLAKATELAKNNRSVWPSMIAGHLKIPHLDATDIYHKLILVGHIDNEGRSILYRRENKIDEFKPIPKLDRKLHNELPSSPFGELFVAVLDQWLVYSVLLVLLIFTSCH